MPESEIIVPMGVVGNALEAAIATRLPFGIIVNEDKTAIISLENDLYSQLGVLTFAVEVVKYNDQAVWVEAYSPHDLQPIVRTLEELICDLHKGEYYVLLKTFKTFEDWENRGKEEI